MSKQTWFLSVALLTPHETGCILFFFFFGCRVAVNGSWDQVCILVHIQRKGSVFAPAFPTKLLSIIAWTNLNLTITPWVHELAEASCPGVV